MKQLSKQEYETTEWWQDTMRWIERIPKELDSKKPVPKKEWRVYEANTWDAARTAARTAARDAAWAAARTAARDAAWAAAWTAAWTAALAAARTAAWTAAWDAAWAAVGNAAGDAALAASRAPAWTAARAAAWDAMLLAHIKICAGLDIDKKHVQHAMERWEANKRGYRVWCDVNGVLYVYRKK